jgi:hypothetical protein
VVDDQRGDQPEATIDCDRVNPTVCGCTHSFTRLFSPVIDPQGLTYLGF